MGASCNCAASTINQPPALNMSVQSFKPFQKDFSAGPNRQNTLIQFSYNLRQHLDDFNDDFYERSFVFEIEAKSKSEPKLPNIRVNEAEKINFSEINIENKNIIAEPESTKKAIYKLCLTYNKYVLQNRKQNRRKKQTRSQEIRIKVPEKGILKKTSKSFDTLSSKKQVHFNYEQNKKY